MKEKKIIVEWTRLGCRNIATNHQRQILWSSLQEPKHSLRLKKIVLHNRIEVLTELGNNYKACQRKSPRHRSCHPT